MTAQGGVTYYRTRVVLTVLSDRTLDGLDIGDIVRECDDGDMVLGSFETEPEAISREQMDGYLWAAGSDPSFFGDEDVPGEAVQPAPPWAQGVAR